MSTVNTGAAAVRVEVHDTVPGHVHVAWLDNPPVNASNAALRAGIVDAVTAATAAGAVGLVLVGARNTFVSGSDLREFAGTVPDPLLPAVVEALELAPFPVVAALDGHALGGGLELALGADRRVGTDRLQVGLPERNFGLVPGAGGTQRLPRLTGRALALEIMALDRRLDAGEAHAAGILDVVVEPADLLQAAVKLASTSRKDLVRDRPVPTQDPVEWAEVVDLVLRKTKHSAAATEAVRLVGLAGTVDAPEGLRDERAAFNRLRDGRESGALRHLFFAARAAGRGPRGVVPPTLSRIGVLGAGAMGRGIAVAAAGHGYDVVLVDSQPASIDRASVGLEEAAATAARFAGCSAGSVALSLDVLALGGCDLVVEAVFEDADVKQAALASAEQVVGADCIIVSNTSYLDLPGLARTLAAPTRFGGLHFFAPADRMRLIEVVPLPHTDEATLAGVVAFARCLGKQPIITGTAEGFVGNRVLQAYRRHAEYLVEDGCLPEHVDAALRDFGFAMGPFAVADLSGLQIAASVRHRLRAEGRAPARDTRISDELFERNWWGRSTGRGYYQYVDGVARPDPEVAAIAEATSAALGIVRREIGAAEIVDRCVGAMVVEAATVVASRVAGRPGDVDLAMVEGFGFPRSVGGPLWWAAHLDPDRLETVCARVEAACTIPVPRAEVTTVLRRAIADG